MTRPEHEDADRTEPDDSAQRRLVEQVAAYEVDPPAPERTRTQSDAADT